MSANEPPGARDRGQDLAAGARQLLEQSRFLLATTRERLRDPAGLAPLSLLPAQVPGPPLQADVVVGDLLVAGRYLPAGGGPEPVAGDFYDVLQAGPDRLVLALGDVTGHGPAALDRMQALRAATRAVALEPVGPRQALAVLDAFCDQQPDEGLATMWYAEYTPSTGRLTYASAGHPPPVLTAAGSPTRLLHLTETPPLGTGLAHALAVEHTLRLPVGATLVAYSDGLVERPDADLDAQLALLREVVHVHSDPALARAAQQVADAILGVLIPDPAAADDDVALMVVRRQPLNS